MGSGGCKFLIVIASLMLTSTCAIAGRGTKIRSSQYIIKTIETDAGDIVDCIHMYNQPALDHPLLLNHTIQTQPRKRTSTLRSKNIDGTLWFNQSWKCPHGYIPIKRGQQNSTHHFTRKYAPRSDLSSASHQYAVIQASTSPGTIHGIHATLNVWNPTVGDQGDFSLTQLWLVAGSGADLNTMEVGWHVFPHINGDSQTRLFIYWTRDDYKSTGCYDVQNCPGFVQTNSQFLIGGPLQISTYGGQQSELDICIEKDTSSGNWWLYVSGNPIGYWPTSLFTTLANAADHVEWGGEVFDSTGGGGLHTSNQMGSGHFPMDGYQRSSYIRGINYMDTSGNKIQPSAQDFASIATIPSCYNLRMENRGELYLFYGGPGCQ